MTSKYCSAVDTGLFVSTMGQVGYCCSGADFVGTLENEPYDEIIKKPRFIEIRQNLKNGQGDRYCRGCDSVDKVTPGISQRAAFNDLYGPQDTRQLKLVDIRWSNVCNLTCRYCNTHDSSEWRRLHNLPVTNVNKDYIESLFQEIEQNAGSIENLYLLGGEPLLQKHNLRLLDLVDKSTVKIDVLTNLSVRLDKNPVYQKLKEFRTVLWNLSFDNICERFEYVRQGADWNVFLENLQRVSDDFGAHRVTFHPVYTLWNCHNIREFYDFALADKKYRVEWQMALAKRDNQFGYGTDSFIVFGHKQKIIERAIKEIERIEFEVPSLIGIKNSLIADVERPGQDRKFLDWTAKMEQFIPPRKSFAELWPELNTLLQE